MMTAAKVQQKRIKIGDLVARPTPKSTQEYEIGIVTGYTKNKLYSATEWITREQTIFKEKKLYSVHWITREQTIDGYYAEEIQNFKKIAAPLCQNCAGSNETIA